jgi:hypothetical protein
VIQMLDGQVRRVIDEPQEIYALANSGSLESAQVPPAIKAPVVRAGLNGKQLVPLPTF